MGHLGTHLVIMAKPADLRLIGVVVIYAGARARWQVPHRRPDAGVIGPRETPSSVR
jgi:hypothetical protein